MRSRSVRCRATRTREAGITLIEMLIALSVIAVAFLTLALAQVNSLRATARSQLLTESKAAANVVLEQTSAEVLKAVTLLTCSTDPLCDQEDSVNGVSRYLSFKFIDYYHYCAPGAWDDGLRSVYRAQTSLPTILDTQVSACSGTQTVDTIQVDWSISSPTATGMSEEGVLDITVTATHPQGTNITVGNTITCYDVYPAPKKETPKPCPEPEVP